MRVLTWLLARAGVGVFKRGGCAGWEIAVFEPRVWRGWRPTFVKAALAGVLARLGVIGGEGSEGQ